MDQNIKPCRRQRIQSGFGLGLTFLLLGIGFSPPAQAQSGLTTQGYGLLKQGLVNDAIATFQQAVQRSPQSVDAKLGLAIAYQRAGQDSNAWLAYQRVLAQDPNNRSALQAVGTLGGYRPEWQATGIVALTTLLNLTPNDAMARAQRALLYGYQGRFAESIADYQLVLSANPQPNTILGAAQIYTYSGNYAQGLALFERYRAVGPIPDRAISAYATALRETGQINQAVQVLEARLKQRPSLDAIAIDLRTALAIAYGANQQSDKVTAILAPLRNQPQATLPLARALSTIGRHRNSGLYQVAIGLYRQALQQAKNPSPGLVTEVADVLSEERSTRAESLRLYQQLIQQQPSDRSLLVKQLILANQLGQIDRTDLNQKLQTLLQPLPTSAIEQQALAQALIRLDSPSPQLLPLYQQLQGVNVPFLNYRIAQMRVQTGDLAGARRSLMSYSRPSGSQDFAAELLLAEIERREGNFNASAQRYEAIVTNQRSGEALTSALQGLAGVRQQQGRLADALQVYDQVLSRDPQNQQVQLGRASVAYQAKRLSEAEAETVLNQWLQTHSATDAPPELFSLVGALPADPNREDLYNTLLTIEPNNLAIARRSLQVLALRDPAQARSRLNQIIARDPADISAYFIQGELAQSLGDLKLASQAYETILQRQPDNADALSALAGVRFQQQRYTDATTLYNRVLTRRPQDVETRRLLAELSLAQDQPFSALQQLRQLRQEQVTAGTSDPVLADRIVRLEVDRLKRRGFQPAWERY